MRSEAQKEMIKLAKGSDKLGNLVLLATEDGFVVGSRLKKLLEDEGYKVESKKGKVGYHVRVIESLSEGGENLIAAGYSGTETDAVKQAIFGAIRENVAGASIEESSSDQVAVQ